MALCSLKRCLTFTISRGNVAAHFVEVAMRPKLLLLTVARLAAPALRADGRAGGVEFVNKTAAEFLAANGP